VQTSAHDAAKAPPFCGQFPTVEQLIRSPTELRRDSFAPVDFCAPPLRGYHRGPATARATPPRIWRRIEIPYYPNAHEAA
jgi:hypothetical protein